MYASIRVSSFWMGWEPPRARREVRGNREEVRSEVCLTARIEIRAFGAKATPQSRPSVVPAPFTQGSPKSAHQPRAPLCKGSWREAPEGLCPCAARTAGKARQAITQNLPYYAVGALIERPCRHHRFCIRNSRRDVGIAPYAKLWIGCNVYLHCVGRAALSPPLLAFPAPRTSL